MAWLIGLATDEEIEALQKRGYEVTEPDEATRLALVLADEDNPGNRLVDHEVQFPGHPENKQVYRTRLRAVQVYVDLDVFNVLSRRGFSAHPDYCRYGDSLCLRYLTADHKPTVPDRLPTLDELELARSRERERLR